MRNVVYEWLRYNYALVMEQDLITPLLVAFFAHQITLPDNTIVKLELWYVSDPTETL